MDEFNAQSYRNSNHPKNTGPHGRDKERGDIN